MVCPSGIGKSYAIWRIAKQGLAYVAYLSFAKSSQRLSGSLSHYRGILDFTLTWIRCREPLTTNLVFVKLCRELGITPAVFFDSQLKDAFKDFQRFVVYLLREYQCKIFEIQNMGQAQCTATV